jgi:hypothetical protein
MKSTTLRSGHARRSASPVVASLEMVSGSRLCRGEPLERRIADILRRAKGDGLTKHDLTRRVPLVDHRRRNAVFAAMIEAGEIVAATKSAIVLRLAEQSASRPPISAPEPEPAAGRPPLTYRAISL